jgi:hypothetical protein
MEDLDGQMAQPADANDHHGAARVSEGQDLLDGVVVGQSGVALRSEGCRVGARRQLDDGTGARPHEVGIAAIHSVDAGELPSRAVHVVAGSAGDAEAARDGRMEHDRIALLQMRYGPAHFLDPASVLVAEGVRQLGVEGSLQATLHDVNVRPADPGAGDPDDHVVRIDDLRLRHIHQLDGLLVSHHLCRSHE